MKRGLVLAATLAFANDAFAREPRFDPLSQEELTQVVNLLVESGRTNRDTRITRVSRLRVAKEETPKRIARIVALLEGQSTEIDADLERGALTFRPIETGYAPITSSDWSSANDALRKDSRWIEALMKRGIEDPDHVFCESLSAGYFPGTLSAETRIMRLPCYEISGATTHIYGRPIEGLVATVDLKNSAVLEILDEGPQPLPSPTIQLPIETGIAPEPANPDVFVDGHRISFGLWSLHASLDDHFGLIISDVSVFDGAQRRQIMHDGHVSEVYVPYMDPTESWAFRTYLDAGEFGFGTLASPLVPGIDCPASAAYLDSHHVTPTARVVSRPRTICAFAEPLRGPIWRHYEALNGSYSGTTGQALVIRSISSIAHYDYVFDWVFGPSGEIEIRIGATGIDAVKAVSETSEARAGNRVTPDLVAVFHDHFFSLRLDLDLDGQKNTLWREEFVVHPSGDNPLSRSYWDMTARTVEIEGPLKPAKPGIWRLVSDAPGYFDEPTGYQFIQEGTVSILSAEDQPQKRGAFSAAPLWVTHQDPEERAAAGDYPNQHPGGAGLPAFSDRENITGADIVLWPTLGFRHVTRVEDWPILSTVWKSVRLRPYGFFNKNPSVEGR